MEWNFMDDYHKFFFSFFGSLVVIMNMVCWWGEL